jgi:hypothetical protein
MGPRHSEETFVAQAWVKKEEGLRKTEKPGKQVINGKEV